MENLTPVKQNMGKGYSKLVSDFRIDGEKPIYQNKLNLNVDELNRNGDKRKYHIRKSTSCKTNYSQFNGEAR